MAKSPAQLDREIAEFVGRLGHHWRGSKVQSLLFDSQQWTVTEARKWASEHGYKSGKVHETDNYIRLRQSTPVSGAEKRTIMFGHGIKAIIEQAK
jgi:hypothetical protein